MAKQKLQPVEPIGRKDWDAANSRDKTTAAAKSRAEYTTEAFFDRI